MWAITTRRPSDQYVGLNRLFNGASPFAGMLPEVDITEDEQAVRMTAEIPGYKPENVKVSLENRMLTMSGEKANGTFRRSFTVSSTIDTDKIEASIEHGVLAVMLPKAEKAKAREIPVKR